MIDGADRKINGLCMIFSAENIISALSKYLSPIQKMRSYGFRSIIAFDLHLSYNG